MSQNPFFLLHFVDYTYPSVDFLSIYVTTSPEEFFSIDIEKPITFFVVRKGIEINYNNLLSFNY